MADPVSTLIDIKAMSYRIDKLKQRRDQGKFTNPKDAVMLQRALNERKRLQDTLPPLRIVVSN